MFEFADALSQLERPERPYAARDEAHAAYLAWSTPHPRSDIQLDLGMVVAAMRDALPADSII